jgi:hypothetical protein
MIAIEKEIRGESSRSIASVAVGLLFPFPRPWRAKTLQEACDQEWKGLFLTKLLFAGVIVLLIAARFG